MIVRRQILLGSALALIAPGFAQAAEPPAVGVLLTGTAATHARHVEALRAGLAEHDLVDGRSIRLVARFADGRLERLPALAAELVGLHPALLVVGSVNAAHAARQATVTLPIVVGSGADLVLVGLADSMARPGGNVTGLSNVAHDLSGKMLELLHEAVPTARRVAVLANAGNPAHAAFWPPLLVAAEARGLTLQRVELASQEALAPTVAGLPPEVDGLLVLPDPVTVAARRELARLLAARRLPAIHPFREFVEDGGLMSYGANLDHSYRRAAGYVAKILKGAKPADLPIEQPTAFELVINARAAEALGLALPPAILARAEEVIE